MIHDWRNREVPNHLTIGGIIVGGIYSVCNGLWFPVLLTSALIYLSDINHQRRRLILATAITALSNLFQPATVCLCIGIFGVWILWEMNCMGGADVKLLMAALLWTGSPFILFAIFLLGGVQGLIALFYKQKEIPFVVSIFGGSLWFFLSSLH